MVTVWKSLLFLLLSLDQWNGWYIEKCKGCVTNYKREQLKSTVFLISLLKYNISFITNSEITKMNGNAQFLPFSQLFRMAYDDFVAFQRLFGYTTSEKKKSLDWNKLKNYRPVSNLSFISKVLERIVYFQFLNHITANKLIGKFQSAYKLGHCNSSYKSR